VIRSKTSDLKKNTKEVKKMKQKQLKHMPICQGRVRIVGWEDGGDLA